MDTYTIELIKQVGAVGVIAILLIKQNGKHYDKLLKITNDNFSKLFDKVEDIWHRQDNSYKNCDELSDYFNEIAESHKLKKYKILVKYYESYKRNNINNETLLEEIKIQFKTLTKQEVQKLNHLKSKEYNKDLGTKFYKKIDWNKYLTETINILKSSDSIADLENRFMALSENYLTAIRGELKI